MRKGNITSVVDITHLADNVGCIWWRTFVRCNTTESRAGAQSCGMVVCWRCRRKVTGSPWRCLINGRKEEFITIMILAISVMRRQLLRLLGWLVDKWLKSFQIVILTLKVRDTIRRRLRGRSQSPKYCACHICQYDADVLT
jgi:hypothetical protein